MRSHSESSLLAICAAAVLAFAVLVTDVLAQDDGVWPPAKPSPSLLVFTDPLLELDLGTQTLTKPYLTLWIEALRNPEVDLQREAAVAIASAHHHKYLDCSSAADALLEVLERKDTHPVVKADVVRALVEIDASKSAAAMMAELATSQSLAKLAEPALARWDHKPMRDVWLERLESGKSFTRLEMRLAVECLGIVRELRAATTFERLVRDQRQPSTIRFTAAAALGSIRQDGQESLAKELFETPGPKAVVDRVAAVHLLLHHESPESAELLINMAQHADAAAAGIAWSRMLQRDPARLLQLVPAALQRPDSKLRGLAVQTLTRDPSAKSVKLLGPILDDIHPEIRTAARDLLRSFAMKHELRAEVLVAVDQQLKTAEWRGLEQAARLSGELDHEPASDRLLELVRHKRPEVATLAAWALRKIDKAENLPPILAILTQMDRNLESGQELELATETTAAHLFETLGQAKYQPAAELALKWVPKKTFRFEFDGVRPSAVWALGKIKTGSKDVPLVNALYARMTDRSIIDPETPKVKYASALAIGRIGSDVKVPQMRGLEPTPLANALALAIGWAVSELTGEPMPAIHKPMGTPGDWFLEPIRSRLKAE